MAVKRPKVHLIPLGGVGEIGKNMLVVETAHDMLVIDAGLAYPEDGMLGIDFIIPDFSYVVERRDKLRGIILTHGQEDHIGALPYLLKEVSAPVYGTRLTMALAKDRLGRQGMGLPAGSQTVHRLGEVLRIGGFGVEFFRVAYAVPDSVGLAIRTPAGLIVHTGDFKFDQTPVDGQRTDLSRLSELGREGVLALLSDSTNAERDGYTPSESVVGESLEGLVRRATGRVVVATFASNLHRIHLLLKIAEQHGRKVAILGKEIEATVRVAMEAGVLRPARETLVSLDAMHKLPRENTILLVSGPQGEPTSGLVRSTLQERRQMDLRPGDTVVFSAAPAPGNERGIYRTMDQLFRQGMHVIYSKEARVHVSGHASREELKMMLGLVRPRFFVPIHGEYRQLIHHASLAEEIGVPAERCLVGENGTVFEFSGNQGHVSGRVTAGRVLVDGFGVGDVGNIVLRDRKQLAQDGVIIVVLAIDRQTGTITSGPDLVSRGFVYVREAESLMEEAKTKLRESLGRVEERRMGDWSALKQTVRDTLGKLLYDRTRRRPMVLPIIMDVDNSALKKA